MNTYITPLAAKVAAVNQAHAIAPALFADLRAALDPFHGKKVINADDSIAAKLRPILTAIVEKHTVDEGRSVHVYRNSSNHTLSYTVKACHGSPDPRGGGTFSQYAEARVYVADLMRDNTLGAFLPAPELRSDYSVEDVEAARVGVRKAEAELNSARNALSPFTMSDN